MNSLKKTVILSLLVTSLLFWAKAATAMERHHEDAYDAYKEYLLEPTNANLMPLFKMHIADNSVAEGLLGSLFQKGKIQKTQVEHFFEYDTDEDAAFFFFNEAADNLGANAFRPAVLTLGQFFYGEKESKYFNLRKAYEYLAALSDNGVPEGQLALGIFLYDNSDLMTDPVKAKGLSLQQLRLAAQNNMYAADYLIFLSMYQNVDSASATLKADMMAHLERAANNENSAQGEAALYAAIYYKNGKLVKRDISISMKYAQKAAQLGNPDGHYFYGKHILMGVSGSPDYSLAEYHLTKADELGNKFAQKQLDKLREKQAFERSLDVFEPELEQVMEMFGAAQSFYSGSSAAGLPKTGGSITGQTAPIDFGSDEQDYSRKGNDFIGSRGQTWRIAGNTMRNIATGEYYRFSGNQITGSRGDRWKINRNRIQSLDNPNLTYKLGRRGIQGSNGTVCRYRANTLRCN